MTEQTRQRLFGLSSAFDPPVTLWIIVGVAGLLVVAPLVLWALSASGRIQGEQRKELWARYRSSLVLAPVLIAPVLLGAAWVILGVLVLSLWCYRDYARATGLFRETITSALVVIGIFAITFAIADNWLGLFLTLPPLGIVLAAAAAALEDKPKGYIQRVGLAAVGFMLLGSGLGHLGFMANDPLYRPMVLMVVFTVQFNDVVAAVVGRSFGGRPLAVNTSPRKTVTGSIAAVVVTTPLVAFLAHEIFKGTGVDRPIVLAALGLIVSVGGQLGDLVLSAVKRDIGITDTGVTLPGYGGLLDRFDSLMLVAPAVFHFVHHFRTIGEHEPVRIFAGL